MEKPFKGMAAGSDKSGSCFYFGGGKEAAGACVFEAGIDAMSYATLQARAGNTDLSRRYYIASGSAGDGNILTFLSGHPGIQKVVLCHDNDAAGHKMAEDLKTKLQPLGYQISRGISRGKDFNEDLCNMIRQEQQELEVTAVNCHHWQTFLRLVRRLYRKRLADVTARIGAAGSRRTAS